jgi:glycosyltransferase involved in cell wall biosynthesis
VTIHDISFEHYPQFFSPRDRLILQTLVPLSARRARRIITVSQHAKQEIMARYQIPGGKIAVTYEAAGERFVPIADPAALRAVRATYSIPDGPFVLALGNLQPRKNIRRLVEAFAGAVEGEGWRVAGGELRQGSTDYSNSPPSTLHPSLVIAGKAKWRESEIFQAVQEAGLAHAVVFPGYVDDDDLPALYSAAAVFVYPSLYEGFGLPPLEAMACGTPVICSKAASLPEVTGDAALSVDPADVDSLAQALCDVLATPGLRADLRQRGLRRAAQFSWSRCATETLAVYREALQTEARER